ncbi:unnamed protein product [Arabidopsis lyrata]|uniref:Uncharacterized protein n=1 Tax=Arabidopsis lyrata subsp. lyrata TaxID=81972 RepID=D7KK17_ARALL|nr:uncharacterized protein LOC9329228 [Arabidopsis lyrata subsp. lyrata]EFH69426.1 hypothetical protein ARALYDRAFT_889609 [Arabidopsis lyrata subsp. lyrata]CAH8253080.1 unnamed protein product [Arabidopsis lyrata]|eukprot:XP_002893167.1 uncharacterized protein LOC9329228 [Arabidopsis lyrata subsp. lyrata]
MSSSSSPSPISAALNSRSDAAKNLNELIARQGPDFGFAKSRMMNGMNNEIKSALGDEYVSKKLHDLKTGYMMNVRDLFLQAHHVARIIKTSWNDDGKAKIYDLVEVVHQPTNERFIAEIDMHDELQKVINVPEDIKKDLPSTFVGNADDLRRLVSAVSGEQVEEIEESVLAKWLARNNGI